MAHASAQPILHDVISTQGRVVRNLVFHERKNSVERKKISAGNDEHTMIFFIFVA